MSSLIPDIPTQTALQQAILNVFDTFKRALTVYVLAQKAYISTDPNYSRFGQHDQNVFAPPVTPQPTVIYGTILYNKTMNWDFIEPATRSNFDQNKLRNSMGEVRLKVDADGYALMQGVQLVQIDNFEFKIVTTPRPHGVFASALWTYYLEKVD